jgi:hypothetical protein
MLFPEIFLNIYLENRFPMALGPAGGSALQKKHLPQDSSLPFAVIVTDWRY